MIRVAMLSKWHVHAGDYARQAQRHPSLQITAVWDEEPERGQAWAQELGVGFEADLDALLARDDVDAVIVDAPTNMHRDVIVKAAQAGKHIFSEKVLGLTVRECEDIFAAVDASGVRLMLSLPRLTDPYYVYAQEALDKGYLGRLNLVRCRLAHNGALPYEGHPLGWLPAHFFDPVQCGGGALIDLGAHPIYLTNRLAGPAKALTARLSSFLNRAVDDNSVVTVEYQSGALGIIEAGFVSSGSPFVLELHGTEGTLVVEDGVTRIRSRVLETNGWVTVDLPQALPSPMEQWVNEIEQGTPPTITRDDMWRLTQINELAIAANREGGWVRL